MPPQTFISVAAQPKSLIILALIGSLLAPAVFAQKNAFSEKGELIVLDANRLLTVALPKKINTLDDAQLAVELDGYDVSLFANVEGVKLSLQLSTPIAEGPHELNVLVFLPDGEIETLLAQSFNAQPLPEASADWKLNSTLATNYRVDEKEEADFAEIRRLSGRGAVSASTYRQVGGWELSADMDALYDSVSQNNPDNEEWALPSYYLSATYPGESVNSKLAMGNIRLQKDDLLFSAYQRRGVEAGVSDLDNRFEVQFFGLKAEPTAGYHGNQVLPAKSQEQVTGATARVAVLDQYLQLSTGYLNGETALGGAGVSTVSGNALEYGGDSWNLALDSQFMRNSIWLHVEYAQSEFDSDGIGVGENATKDDAAQALLQLSSEGDFGSGVFDFWSGVLQHQKVGADFFSLGNLSLPGDRALNRLLFKGARGGLGFEVSWSDEENNTDNDPTLPTQTLNRVGSDINYTPMWLNPENPVWQLLGNPSLAARYYRTRQDQPGEQAEVYGFDLDNTTDETGLTLSFARNTFNWSVQYQLIDRDDRSREVYLGEYLANVPPSDSENHLTGVQLGWFPSQRFSLNASVQWNKQIELDSGNRYRRRNFSIGGHSQVIPDEVSVMVNYNYGKNTSDLTDNLFVEEDFQSQFVNGQVTWSARKSKGIHPGINIYLKGSYGLQDNQAFSQTTEQWSALLGAEVFWDTGARR